MNKLRLYKNVHDIYVSLIIIHPSIYIEINFRFTIFQLIYLDYYLHK